MSFVPWGGRELIPAVRELSCLFVAVNIDEQSKGTLWFDMLKAKQSWLKISIYYLSRYAKWKSWLFLIKLLIGYSLIKVKSVVVKQAYQTIQGRNSFGLFLLCECQHVCGTLLLGVTDDFKSCAYTVAQRPSMLKSTHTVSSWGPSQMNLTW